MELINETAFASHMYRGSVEEDLVHATVVVRSTFHIDVRGSISSEIPQTVRVNEEQDADGVSVDDDGAPAKAGVDVCIVGHIEAPRPGTRDLTVLVGVGTVQRALRVIGDRTWHRRPGIDFEAAQERSQSWRQDLDALVATEPEPFEMMPMSWARAFGGVATVGATGKVPFAENPFGRGFLLTLEGAEGTSLPNLEDPDRLIRTWQDHPAPVCFAPMPRPSKLRTDRGLSVDVQSQRATVSAAFFNVSHPWLLFDEVSAGTVIRVEGMTRVGRFECRVPDVPMVAEIRIASRSASLPLAVDAVEVDPVQRTISIVSRTAFRYRIRPEEDRFVRVFAGHVQN